MIHPTSKAIWDFQDETGYTDGQLSAILRVFIAQLYDEDERVLESLELYLEEAKQAKKDLDPPVSKFDPEAKVTEEKYWCPDCGAPVFANTVAVWCSKSELEGGNCDYRLMSG